MVMPSSPFGENSHISEETCTLVDFHLPARPGPPETRSKVALSSIASPLGFLPLVTTFMVLPSAEILVEDIMTEVPMVILVSKVLGSICFQEAVEPQMEG